MARDLPPDGFTFTHTPAVDFLNVPSSTFLSARPLVRGAATGALVFSRAPVTTSSSSSAAATDSNASTGTGTNQPPSEPQDRILIVQRAPHDSMPLRWEVPGGACDPEDPTMLHGLARELWEEAGLKLRRVVRPVGDEHVFLTRRGRAVAKVTCEVEVETVRSEGGDEALPEVVLDPNEHVRFVWATEEECRKGRAVAVVVDAGEGEGEGERTEEVEIQFTTQAQREVVLQGFELRKKREP
ncbi:hypothetical protein VTJ83DRAFT_1343 [Remersonia thermophila]|uniref:Nudix hydrolase domain-containing protein n=1 Tax=Remersonia thermophila TaxID=72144 RepID=A0ABR4DNS8_9PEZI